MNKPIIEIKNLSKKYILGERQPYYSLRDSISNIVKLPSKKQRLQRDEFWALKDVTFDVNEGDVVGIIGRNGAGKSTLLKVLSQITPPTEGEAILRGRVASLLEVGTGFHPELTGRENIYLNGAILGMKRWEINNKFNEIVEFAEIEKFINTPVKYYSSGMYMRLAFAVAAHLEPEILIVDEVLAVGDAQFQKKCLGKMSEVSKEGRTVLFVSHNMGAVEGLCNRVIALDEGGKTFDGNTNKGISFYSEQIKKIISVKKLSERKDRTGNKKILLSDFWIEDANKNIIESIKSGQIFSFVFKYECNSRYPIEVDFGFSIHKTDTSTLSIIYSSYLGKTYKIFRGKGTIRFEVRNLTLNQGNYIIGTRILADGQESDWIRNGIGEIHVENSNYYQHSKGVVGTEFPILLNGKWSYENRQSFKFN